MGVAFENIRAKEEGLAYFPTVSLSFSEKCFMNYGALPFEYPVDGYQPMQSDGQIKYIQSQYLCQCIENLLTYDDHLHFEDSLIIFANIFQVFVPLLIESRASHIAFVKLLLKHFNNKQDNHHHHHHHATHKHHSIPSRNDFLVQLFHFIDICLLEESQLDKKEEKKERKERGKQQLEKPQFIKKLLWEIGYRARTNSWMNDNTGSTKYLQLFYFLVKLPMIERFLASNETVFFEVLDDLFDIKLPNHNDMKSLFPIQDLYELPELHSTCSIETLSAHMQENQHTIMLIFQYLLDLQADHILFGKLKRWISLTIQKNKSMLRSIHQTNTTNVSVLFNIFSALLSYLNNDFLSDKSFFENHKNSLYYIAKSKLALGDYARVGGTSKFVTQNFPIQKEDIPPPSASCSSKNNDDGDDDNTTDGDTKVDPRTNLQMELFEFLMLLCISGVGKGLQRAGDRLSAYVETCSQMVSKNEEENDDTPSKEALAQKREAQGRICFWDKVFWLRPSMLSNLWNFSSQIAAFIHHVQSNEKLFQYIPEFFFIVMCDSFYFIRHGTNPKFDCTSNENAEKFDIYVSVLINNLSNPSITTTGMNTYFQYKFILLLLHSLT